MSNNTSGNLKNENLRIAIVASRFNKPVTDNLVEGALTALREKGVQEDFINFFYVPGAFEIPSVLKKICRQNIDRNNFDGVMTIGCVIKGETAHFEYISESVSIGISKISYEYEMPLGFCVLTCYTPQQAYERSIIPPNSENNKGYEAALTVIEMIYLLKSI